MAKYRKKPVVIDAIQWPADIELREEDDPIHDEIDAWFRGMGADPDKIMMMDDGTISIATLEGEMAAQPGDWVIRGIKGEFYPCKPDIFDATYEKVKENSDG